MGPVAIIMLVTLAVLLVGAAYTPARMACCLVGAAFVAIVFAMVMLR
jgi:hypothetical protein